MSQIGPKLTIEDETAQGAATAPTGPAHAQGEAASGSPEGGASAPGEASDASPGQFKERLRAFVRGHEHAVLGGALGLLAAFLVFAVGLFQTLFILLCVLVGVAVGQYLDGNPTMVKVVRRLFTDNRN